MAFNEGPVNATSWFDGTLAAPLRALFGPRGLLPLTAAANVDDEPLRAQLFTAEEMEHHGRHLAAGHELTRAPRRDRLLPRLGREREDADRGVHAACAERRESAA